MAPDGADSNIADQSIWQRLITFGLYLVVVLAVMGAAHWLRFSARRSLDLAELEEQRRVVSNDAALLGERSRLARDLHDVVAHSARSHRHRGAGREGCRSGPGGAHWRRTPR